MRKAEMDLRERFIETNGIKLHVMEAGPSDGPMILFLHGFPEFWYGWRRQIPALVDAGFRVIVPDQRGYNLSDKPRGVAAYHVDILARDVIGLLDHFGIQKARLVGHDWGAVVAWTVALQHSDRLEKLAILNVPHPAVMLSFLGKSLKQMRKSWYIGFFQIPGLADWLMKRDDFHAAASLLKRSGKDGTFSDADIAEYKKAWKNSGGLTGMINWYRALMRHRLSMPAGAKLNMPVLILWGKQDVALGYEMAVESLKHCENGRLVTFENATHWVQHDEADEEDLERQRPGELRQQRRAGVDAHAVIGNVGALAPAAARHDAVAARAAEPVVTHVVVAVQVQELGAPLGIDDEPVGGFAPVAAQMMSGRHGVRDVDRTAQLTGLVIVAGQLRAGLSREGRPNRLALLEDSRGGLDAPD